MIKSESKLLGALETSIFYQYASVIPFLKYLDRQVLDCDTQFQIDFMCDQNLKHVIGYKRPPEAAENEKNSYLFLTKSEEAQIINLSLLDKSQEVPELEIGGRETCRNIIT